MPKSIGRRAGSAERDALITESLGNDGSAISVNDNFDFGQTILQEVNGNFIIINNEGNNKSVSLEGQDNASIGVDNQNDQTYATQYDFVLRGGIVLHHVPQDVRNISNPSQGDTAYHDGSGSNTEGLVHHNGTSWISTVDGSTIS